MPQPPPFPVSIVEEPIPPTAAHGCESPNASLLRDIVQTAQVESVAAAHRHDEMLSRLHEIEKAFKDVLSDCTLACKNPLPAQATKRDSYVSEDSKRSDKSASQHDCLERSATPTLRQRPTLHPEDLLRVTESLAQTSNLKLHASSRISPDGNLSLFTVGGTMVQIAQFMKDDRFEIGLAAVILINALCLCFEVQYYGLDQGYDLQMSGRGKTADGTWPGAMAFITISDWLFGLVFLFEAALKVGIFRSSYFVDAWNWLDLMCVLAFLFDKIAAAVSPVDGKSLRLIRLARLIRVTRLFRTMEAFDSLFIMTTTIKGMKQILFWAVTLLSILLMTVALLLTQILQASYFNGVRANDLTDEELQTHQRLYLYFGTFTRSFFTMFELTLANYPEAARLLTENVSEWLMLLVIVHKLTIGFAVVGVINGVILQETFKVASIDDMIMLRQKERASNMMRQKMVSLFGALDLNRNGKISFSEFRIISEIPEVKTWLASMDVETDDLEALFILVDIDKSGFISLEEMIQRLPRISGPAKCIDVLALDQKLQNSSHIKELSINEHDPLANEQVN